MLEELRRKAVFQNTVDVWIALCGEKGREWYDVEGYRAFIGHLMKSNVRMNRFPLCVKETGGYERSRDKVALLEALSTMNTKDALVYVIKLDDSTLKIIRGFGT
ncbi:MAG: hypothetical protein RMJ59_04190 [Candidatus Nitrosocaldus sp.]|nr:hypothetical protein [Candidatus Nitrosocaldus sp.]